MSSIQPYEDLGEGDEIATCGYPLGNFLFEQIGTITPLTKTLKYQRSTSAMAVNQIFHVQLVNVGLASANAGARVDCVPRLLSFPCFRGRDFRKMSDIDGSKVPP
jgi:hypothetical protein